MSFIAPPPSPWLPEHVAGIARQTGWALPVIGQADVSPLIAGQDLWGHVADRA